MLRKVVMILAFVGIFASLTQKKTQAFANYSYNGCSAGYQYYTITWSPGSPQYDTPPTAGQCTLTPSYCYITSSTYNSEQAKCQNLNKPRNPVCSFNYYHNNQPATLRIGLTNNC